MSAGANKVHVVPLRVYLAVGAALFTLTALTVWVASLNLGGWNAVAAFAIAGTKTVLVALFFMHLFYDRKMYLMIFLTGLLFLAILISLTMFDVLERDDLYDVVAQPIDKQATIYQSQGRGAPADTLFDSTGHVPVPGGAPSEATPDH